MDSHRSVPPMRPPARSGVDATSRSADGDVTRRRQTDHLALALPPRRVDVSPTSSGSAEIAEFHDVRRRDDGIWIAVHDSGQVITAPSLRRLQYIEALKVRILHSLHTSGAAL
ncbi:hypothetical protein AB0L53_54810 [Nonomuraea sp. NPDC052129]|uniref:hypothetical protein n=1 Tax=Nonomuraea sp. NPDC052129 TaxID=3154651 RepID=UPI00342CFF19